MKKLYFVRHGETDANAAKLVQSATTVLSEKGHQQAKVLAVRLQQVSFAHLLVSDYTRTRQTVEPLLAYTDIQPVYTDLVRETKRPSQYVGIYNESPEYHRYLDEADLHIADKDWHLEDEENFYDIMDRVKRFFAYIDSLEGDTLVVSHGRFTIFLMMYVITQGKLTPELWLPSMHSFTTTNTGITVFGFKEQYKMWSLITYNDHAHFAE